MASRPSKWRVLAVTAGVDLPTNGEYNASGAGPLQEFADPTWNEAEVCHMAVYRGFWGSNSS